VKRTAHLVVDLGFGDAGKGLVTDFLVRRHGATVVVRFNGGAQAGHNVVTSDGRHHTFSQFGAGTFVPGVKTLLARHVAIHPTALLVEADVLARKGVDDPLGRIAISAAALVVTPFHQAANRIREIARGAARHGSCGVGVGEAVRHALASPAEAMRARDLLDPVAARAILRRTQDRLAAEVEGLVPADHAEQRVLADRRLLDLFLDQTAPLRREGIVVDDASIPALLRSAPSVVFEGAQGVLLDQDHGFHPHTTWSRCTFDNALELSGELDAVSRLGVLRALPSRHGAGPFPTEDAAVSAAVVEPHNLETPWQGRIRHGWFDAVLARYAIEACGGVDGLALTHLDAVERLSRFRVCDAYETRSAPRVTAAGEEPSEALTRWLNAAKPLYRDADPRDAAREVADLAGAEVTLISRGPTAGDVEST
jgi:adenylosuccinate synthase